jgi:hypothetical protein
MSPGRCGSRRSGTWGRPTRRRWSRRRRRSSHRCRRLGCCGLGCCGLGCCGLGCRRLGRSRFGGGGLGSRRGLLCSALLGAGLLGGFFRRCRLGLLGGFLRRLPGLLRRLLRGFLLRCQKFFLALFTLLAAFFLFAFSHHDPPVAADQCLSSVSSCPLACGANRSVQSWPGTARRPIEKLNRVHDRN